MGPPHDPHPAHGADVSSPVEVLHREGFRRKVLVPLGGVEHVLSYDEAQVLARSILAATHLIFVAEACERVALYKDEP